jgi:tetratricopeptide (TPR) repeat protein
MLLALLLLPAAAAQDGYDEALARYEECQARPPFTMHARGWTALAKTGYPRAVGVLAKDYARPHSPDPEFARYLVTSIATRHLKSLACVEPLDAWRVAHAEPEDAWLWARALEAGARRGQGDTAVAALREQDDVFLRAAAIEALAAAGDTRLFEIAPEVALDMPRDPEERAVLVGALADALLALRAKQSTKEYRSMAVPIIRLLDDEDLPYAAKLALARHLMRALDQDTLVMDSQPWVDALAGRMRKSGSDELGYVKPTFFGVEGSGKRIVYVVDASDSMCKKITIDRPKGPESGPKRKRAKGELPTEADIPWHRVETRFDLAREHLKISLQRLSKDQHFCVVLFGDGARTLKATRGLVAAKSSTVKKALAELEKIEEGPPKAMRPDGTLEGMTNLHAGLRMAFGAIEKKIVGEGAYVNLDTYIEGADTIFLLSDGDPTWDDWDQVAPNYNEDRLGDPESHIAVAYAEQLHYSGPFVDWFLLLDDVRRMNLFREVELHGIAIGEVQMPFLKMLADIGMGQAVQIGHGKK